MKNKLKYYNIVVQYCKNTIIHWTTPEMPSPVNEQALKLVRILLKEYAPKEQNEIILVALKKLKEERIQLAQQKERELQNLLEQNAVLFQIAY